MSKYHKIALVLIVLIMVAVFQADAQCSMCTKTAMDAMKDGNTASRHLNKGILYLMSGPYLIVAIIVTTFVVILRRRKKQMEAEGIADFF